jgi:hypothetical protein
VPPLNTHKKELKMTQKISAINAGYVPLNNPDKFSFSNWRCLRSVFLSKISH